MQSHGRLLNFYPANRISLPRSVYDSIAKLTIPEDVKKDKKTGGKKNRICLSLITKSSAQKTRDHIRTCCEEAGSINLKPNFSGC